MPKKKAGPLIQVGSFGSNALRVRELLKIIDISREDGDGFTIAEYVAQCLHKLDLDLLETTYTAAIVVTKRGLSHERWWDELTIPSSGDIKLIFENDSRSGKQKHFVCYSLSALREVLHRIRDAKIATRPGRSRRQYLQRLSTWGLASAILLLKAVFREVYVIGERKGDMRWCCEWMLGEADENGDPPDRFLVDLPLRIVKGCSILVITQGAFALRIDNTKALKLMRVSEVYRKDFKVNVLRAGAAKPIGSRSTKVKVAPRRYIRVRDCSAVISTDVPFGQLRHRTWGYARSHNAIHLD